jgi:hypothetical protein
MTTMPSTTDAVQPPAMLHCMICGAVTPHPQPHACRLSKRDQARKDAWLAKRAAIRAAEMAPRPCEICQQPQTPGTGHWCAPQPSVADRSVMDAKLADLRQGLRAAGYELKPIDPA